MAELCSTIQCSFVFTRLAVKMGGGGRITPRGRFAPGYPTGPVRWIISPGNHVGPGATLLTNTRSPRSIL